MEKPMTSAEIPQTDSIEELARFWDAHDLTEFEEQLEEVTEHVFERKPDAVLTIRLRPQEVEAVNRIASARGLEQTALLREWVLEKLHNS